MRNEDVGRDLRAGSAEYASLADRASRTSVRARVLGLIDKLALAAGGVEVRAADAEELRGDAALRGALVMHLDLASRSAITSTELLYTAARGRVLVAEHRDLSGFPVGVALALPTVGPPSGRRGLFDQGAPDWDRADTVCVYALATNPGRLGAGMALIRAAMAVRGERALMAYAPLTGLRARIIQVVDDEATWAGVTAGADASEREALSRQLTDLLARTTLPDLVDEPARGFLAAEARAFAADEAYSVGRFHRHLGAQLIGVDDAADSSDCDAMWARAYFRY